MIRWVLAVVVVVGSATGTFITAQPPPPDVRYSPDQVLIMVADDIKKLSPTEAKYARYQTLRMGATPEERDNLAKLATANLHELTGLNVPMPLISSKEWSEGTIGTVRVNEVLVRFNSKYLGKTFQEQWERLGKQEPYWHGDNLEPVETDEYETVEREVEIGFWVRPDGSKRGGGEKLYADEKWEPAGKKTVKKRQRKVATNVRGLFVRTEAGRTALIEIQKRMYNPTTNSYGTDVPVVDADWFWGQTTADQGRDPGYRKFIGYNTRVEFEKVAGVIRDPKVLNEVFLQELREIAGNSEVTTPQTMRRIVNLPKVGGEVWFTLDANQELAKDKAAADPTNNLGDGYEHQAEEWLAHNSVGFILMALFNAAGEAQDVAPGNIANDSTGLRSDKQVHNGMCKRCHIKGYRKPIGWARDVMNRRPNALTIKGRKGVEYTEDEVFKIRQQYVGRLDTVLDRSMKRYADALHETTGWKPEEYSAQIKKTWADLVESPVDMDLAARRLGVTTQQLQDALVAKPTADKLKTEGKSDEEIAKAVYVVTQRMENKLAAYRPKEKDDPTPYEPIPAVLFRNVFQRAADVVHGTVRPFDIREK